MEKRKRKLVDTTINYWRFSSLMLITGSVLFIVYTFFPNDTFLWITGVIFGYGFIISLINGMLYKIVPFLTWFHVSSKGFFDIPTMREMIPDKNAKIQLYFHIASVIVLTLLPFFDLLKIAAFLIAVSNILLFLNMPLSMKSKTAMRKMVADNLPSMVLFRSDRGMRDKFFERFLVYRICSFCLKAQSRYLYTLLWPFCYNRQNCFFSLLDPILRLSLFLFFCNRLLNF